MDKKSINFYAIGTIQTPFMILENMPIQPSAAKGVRGKITLNEEFSTGLSDLEGFSHIYLIYHLHLSTTYTLRVQPFLENTYRGLFSTRAPKRPNPIGLSVVKLINILGNHIVIENVDMINGTPLLDIKPFVPEMENAAEIRIGWLQKHRSQLDSKKSDNRFID